MKVRNLSIQQRDFILNMSDVVTAVLFIITGIGSYRILIVFAIERSLSTRLQQKTVLIGVLAYIFSAYFDFMNGPIIFPDTKNYFIIVFLAFIAVRLLIQKSFKRMISDLTQNQYFETCPSCHYHNSYLVGSCSNCDYKKGDNLPASTSKISDELKGDKIPPRLTNLLVFNEDEKIIFHKNLNSFTGKLKNGETILRKHLLITSKSIVMLNYTWSLFQIPKCWTDRDIIPLSDVIAVEGKMKQGFAAERPSLKIRTIQNDSYEIVFSGYGDYISEINDIAAIIKSVNPQVETAIILTQKPWSPGFRLIPLNTLLINDTTDTDRNKRMLILLPLILILLGLVLWQVFHSEIN